jgi:hypothetical protein
MGDGRGTVRVRSRRSNVLHSLVKQALGDLQSVVNGELQPTLAII